MRHSIPLREPFKTVLSASQSWSSYWTKLTDKLLFFGEVSKISGGKLYNQMSGSSDYLTVGGSVGSYTFQAPNTAAYIAADTDNVWFYWDGTQRTATEAELVGFDLQRTPVKYDNSTPYPIQVIAILKSGATLSADELQKLYKDFQLSIFWSGVYSDDGILKASRIGYSQWVGLTAEAVSYVARCSTAFSTSQKVALNNFFKASITNGYYNDFGVIRLLHLHNENDSLLNIKSASFTASKAGNVVFTAYSGWKSADGTGYINNNYIPATAGDMTQNDATYLEYFDGVPTSPNPTAMSGVTDGTRQIALGSSGGVRYYRINQSAGAALNPAQENGLNAVMRNGASSNHAIVNANQTDGTTSSNGLPTKSIYSLAFNNNDTEIQYVNTSKRLRAVMIGKATILTKCGHIKTDLETFFTAFTA